MNSEVEPSKDEAEDKSENKVENVIRVKDIVPFFKNLTIEILSLALKVYFLLFSWQILYSDMVVSIQPTLSSTCVIIFLIESRHFLFGKLLVQNSEGKNV